MNTSVIIPAFGDPVLTAEAVRSVYTNDGLAEVVLVDNDGQAAGIEVDARVVNPVNVGFARACNQGAWAATGDVLLFLNNDCQVSSRRALTLLAEHAMVHGVAGCHLTYPDGRTQHGGVSVFRNPQGVIWAENILHRGDSGSRAAVTAACMAVRRDVFARVEGFDVRYWNGLEDVDLCLRAREAGAGIWYESSIGVVHHESASGPERWSKVRQNISRFHEVWDERFERLGV